MTKRIINGVCFDECPKQDLGRYEPIPRPKPSQCDCDFSNYYTKEEVDRLVNAIKTGKFVIVDELPEQGDPKDIYLVPKAGGGYTEYYYIGGEPVTYPCIDFKIYSCDDEQFASDHDPSVNGNLYPIDEGQYKVTICGQEYTCSLEYKEQETDTMLVYGISCEEFRIGFAYFSDTDITDIHLELFKLKPSCVVPTDIPSESYCNTYKYTLDNVCIEKVGGKWEELGDTDIDLSEYAKTSELNALETRLQALIDEKQDKLTKQDILDLLGYVEVPMSMEDEDGNTVDVLVLGKVV